MKQENLYTLLAQMREGKEAAFSEVYSQLAKPVYVIAYRITQNKEQAEDVTQDLFLKLFLTPPDESVRNPRAWIFRMVHNLAIDAIRQPQHEALSEILPDPAHPEEDVLLHTALETAMQSLDAQEREILSLHLNAELTFQEIARLTSRSLPAVYRCYRRALHRLRAALEEGESS